MQHHVEVVRGLVLAKMKITSKLPHAKETPLEKEITYICGLETMVVFLNQSFYNLH